MKRRKAARGGKRRAQRQRGGGALCKARQLGLGLELRQHGGARRGAGRKPKGRRAGVDHRPRERFTRHQPVHCSMTLADDIANLRSPGLYKIVEGAIYSGAAKLGFRVVHFSVQRRHLHLIIEATNRLAMGRGMQGLTIRLAKRINKALGRRGRVFVGRYFSRVLRTPGETRRCLNYVLQNHRRHKRQRGKAHNPYNLDICSSARRFSGWKEIRYVVPEDGLPIGRPRCWLLREGWMKAKREGGEERGRRLGLLSVREEPARWRA